MAYIFGGLSAAAEARDREAIDIAVALYQIFAVFMWRPATDGNLPVLDFVKEIAFRCVSFITKGADELVETMLPRMLQYSREKVSASTWADRKEEESPVYNASLIESLLKDGDMATAVARSTETDAKFLHISEETAAVLLSRCQPDNGDANPATKLTRQGFHSRLESMGAKTFVPTMEMVENAFKAGEKGRFKKNKAPGPSGLSNRHLSAMLSVPSTRLRVLKGLRKLFGLYYSPLLSDMSAEWLYFSKGALLSHKSGVTGKLKVISMTRLAQKMAGKGFMKLGVLSPIFSGVQNAMSKDGVTRGPMLLQAKIDLEAKKEAPNQMLAVVGADIPDFTILNIDKSLGRSI